MLSEACIRMQAAYSNSLFQFQSTELSEGRGEMDEKGKKEVVVEDSCSEDEALNGANKNGIGIESAEQFFKDTNDDQAEMREMKKQTLSISDVISSVFHVSKENKPAVLSENEVVELESIIDDKEEDKPEEVSIGVETRLMVEGEPDFRNENMRAPRYSESADWEACYKCSRDSHKGKCKLKKKRKPCYNCGDLGHEGKRCKQVKNCFICSNKGHLAKDCPMDQPEKDRFCVKCGNPGHDMFSCTDEYCSEDLKACELLKIVILFFLVVFSAMFAKSLVISAVLTIKVKDLDMFPVSTVGSWATWECTKFNEQLKTVCSKCGEGGHPPKECIKSPEVGGSGNTEDKEVATNPVNKKSTKTRKKKKNKKKPEATVNVSCGSPNGNRRWHATQANGLYFARPGSNVWLSPVAAAAARRYSNQYFSQHPYHFFSHQDGTQLPPNAFDYQIGIRFPHQIYNHQNANPLPQQTLNHQNPAQLPHPVLDHQTRDLVPQQTFNHHTRPRVPCKNFNHKTRP
ncbi:unnamed protein product [Fraxinus pennsylvanica]|uniref:CCHC-type domain-containing protein n=1 Tax=Fraxinus pennsylvanica TaxID=56036 RepID=A0AAD2A8C6_9LAMI|nr:unnamed protein product [Fraxinus pennsylvanica]